MARSDRLLSLAAGTLLDVSPPEAVEAAGAAGWPAVGIWYDPVTWNRSVCSAVVDRLDSTGVVALDIEPVIFGRGDHHGAAIIDAAAEVGARFVLVASGPAPRQETVDGLGALAALAAERAPELTVVLEFLPIFTIATLAAAASVIVELDRPNLGVLVDTLHLARSGGRPDDLRAYDAALFPYLQVADATTAPVDNSLAGLRDEALFGRLLPGAGVLPLGETMRIVADVPVSVELRSRQLYADFPDAARRAKRVLDATRSTLPDSS